MPLSHSSPRPRRAPLPQGTEPPSAGPSSTGSRTSTSWISQKKSQGCRSFAGPGPLTRCFWVDSAPDVFPNAADPEPLGVSNLLCKFRYMIGITEATMCQRAGNRDGRPPTDGESHRNQEGLFRSSSPTAIHTNEKRGPDRLPTKVNQDHAAGTSHWCVHGKQRL
jgi:hypothetical protein